MVATRPSHFFPGGDRMRRIVALAALGLAGLVLAGCTTSGGSGQALGLVADGEPSKTPDRQFRRPGPEHLGARRRRPRPSSARCEFGRTGLPVTWKDGEQPRRSDARRAVPRQRLQLPRLYPCRHHRRRTAAERPRDGVPAAKRVVAGGDLTFRQVASEHHMVRPPKNL